MIGGEARENTLKQIRFDLLIISFAILMLLSTILTGVYLSDIENRLKVLERAVTTIQPVEKGR